ncbi:hypothetical protein Tco_0597746 [Tanacetum coccineum]
MISVSSPRAEAKNENLCAKKRSYVFFLEGGWGIRLKKGGLPDLERWGGHGVRALKFRGAKGIEKGVKCCPPELRMEVRDLGLDNKINAAEKGNGDDIEGEMGVSESYRGTWFVRNREGVRGGGKNRGGAEKEEVGGGGWRGEGRAGDGGKGSSGGQ